MKLGLGHGSSHRWLGLGAVAPSEPQHLLAPPACSAIAAAPSKLEPVIATVAHRLNSDLWWPGQAGDMHAVLAASELLRACDVIEQHISLGQQQKLHHATVSLRCFVSCSRAAASVLTFAAGGGSTGSSSTGSGSSSSSRGNPSSSAQKGSAVVLSSLLELMTAATLTVQRLGAAAAQLASPAEVTACFEAAVTAAQAVMGSTAAGGCTAVGPPAADQHVAMSTPCLRLRRLCCSAVA